MLAIATAVAAAIPTMPIMPNGNRAVIWRSAPPVFVGRFAGRTRPLAIAGVLVEVGGGGAATVDGLAADSTGMTVAAAGVGWGAAGTDVAAEGLLVCGVPAGI